MKKFLPILVFISTFIPAVYGMENLSKEILLKEEKTEQKNLKRTCEVIDLTDGALDNPVDKKRPKVEEVNLVVRCEVAKEMADWSPITYTHSGSRPKFVQVASAKTARKKEFWCSRCDTAFLNEKNFAAHNTYSYCGKKAKLALEKPGK